MSRARFTPVAAPEPLLADWLQTIADVNPTRYVLEGIRQGFVYDVGWSRTWPALLALAGMLLVLGALAVRGMRRIGR